MAFSGGRITTNSTGTFAWPLNGTQVRAAEVTIANSGLGSVGRTSVIETDGPGNFIDINLHGSWTGTFAEIDLWVVQAQTVTNANRFTPGIVGELTADAAAITDRVRFTLVNGVEKTYTLPLTQTFVANTKLLVLGQPTPGSNGTLTIASLFTDMGSVGSSLTADNANVDTTWALSSTRSIAMWANFQVTPSLNSNYPDQQLALGAAVNIDTSTVWSGVDAASYSAIDLPPGLSISTAGVITGNIAMGGVLDTTITCTAVTGAKLSSGFTWYVEAI